MKIKKKFERIDYKNELLPDYVEYAFSRLASTKINGQVFYDDVDHGWKERTAVSSNYTFVDIYKTKLDPEKTVFVFGAFYKDKSTNDSLEEQIDSIFEQGLDGVDYAIFASFDDDSATRVRDAFCSVYPAFKETPFILYGLSNNDFTSSEGSLMPVDDIWSAFYPVSSQKEDIQLKDAQDLPVNEEVSSDMLLKLEEDASTNEHLEKKEESDFIEDDIPEIVEYMPIDQPEHVEPFNGDSKSLAAEMLMENTPPKDKARYLDLLHKLLAEKKSQNEEGHVDNTFAQALMLIKGLSHRDSDYSALFKQLVFALDSSIEEHEYSGNDFVSIFDDKNPDAKLLPTLKLSALCHALFAPSNPYDEVLSSYAQGAKATYDVSFPSLAAVKSLFNILTQVRDVLPQGFTAEIIRSFSDKKQVDEAKRDAIQRAKELLAIPKKSNNVKNFPKYKEVCFGSKSDFRKYLNYVVDDDISKQSEIINFISDYCEEKDGDPFVISNDLIDFYMQSEWRSNDVGNKEAIKKGLSAYKIVYDAIVERISVMKQWLLATENVSNRTYSVDIAKAQKLRKQLLEEIDKVLNLPDTALSPIDNNLFKYTSSILRQKLNGVYSSKANEFNDLLRTEYFCMNYGEAPYDYAFFEDVTYYEPYRLALLHISTPSLDLRDVLQKISNPANRSAYDNIGQAVAIYKYLNANNLGNYNVEDLVDDLDSVIKTAESEKDKFKGELERAFAYGRISENLKEDILEELELGYSIFNEYNNYGCFNLFLDALRRTIVDATEARITELKADIEERLANNKSPIMNKLLETAIERLNDPENNLVVAEEYINRFDSGVPESMDIYDSANKNIYLDFIHNEFGDLYALCTKHEGGAFKNFARDYLIDRLKKDNLSTQYRDSSGRLVKSMPDRREQVSEVLLGTLLKELGFSAKETGTQIKHSNMPDIVHYQMAVVPDTKDKAEYSHPVDIMGTKLKSPMDVVCLFGKKQPNDIVDKVCQLELNRTAIVLLNGALDINARRQIAERFHRDKSGQNPFLLIDQVLLLYLATKPKNERLPILLNCTLPYTSSFQPFVISGSVSDEMFIGRKKELQQILDPNGPSIVYGGRQLGKTALLERASSLANHAEKKEFAILVRAQDCFNEDDLVRKIRKELSNLNIVVPECVTTKDLCFELRKLHTARTWTKLLLLIDETDNFLENFKTLKPAYAPITHLNNLVRDTGRDFKFVLAGLHNVCRGAKDPNTVFGQLGEPLCIKPLSAVDALELLSKPLKYMGFDVLPSQLEYIIVNTSFYPGIIHYVGYDLVQNLSTRYADYYKAVNGNPPYNLTDAQLGVIMSGNALNEKINERIRWTLDVDPRYFMIARCIAYCYNDYPERNKAGHALEDIMDYSILLGIKNLEGLGKSEFKSLLLELVEMGILVEPTKNHFRLRQRRFLDAIGNTREKIELAISEAQEE